MKKSIAFVLAAALLATAADAMGQAWPSKPLRVVVAFTPGSATDIIARALADRLTAQLGQAVLVENRPGASGTVGAAAVARAEPDGYTLLVNSSAHTVAPLLIQGLSYDALRDLAGVAPLAALPTVLVVLPGKGYRSAADLVATAKARPGKLNYASGGPGSGSHLNAERFRLSAGFEAVHVPFKGADRALFSIIAGDIDFYFSPINAVMPMLKDGRLAAIAVGGSRRAAALPEIPTTIEAGYTNSDYNFWVGLFAPSRTPREIVQRLYQEATSALRAPNVAQRLSHLGAEPMTMTPEQFDAHLREEAAINAQLVRAVGLKPN